MTVAEPAPPAAPPAGMADSGMHSSSSGPSQMIDSISYSSIAMSPNPANCAPPSASPGHRACPISGRPEQSQQQQRYQFPPLHHLPSPGSAPPPTLPPPGPASSITAELEQIENRLRQIEQEEAYRAAVRAYMLNKRKREDEEFRMVTERAEAEEEELRRRRKRLKREAMGLTHDPRDDSPPRLGRRRLSETNAATALACFKQQSLPQPHPSEPWRTESWQPESRQPEIRPPPPPPPPPPAPVTMEKPLASMPPTPVHTNYYNTRGPFRKKQRYTIKNAEAWGERHGRPATYDPAGRALWKRPSDGRLVYLDCPVPGCGKSDFVTLHGFMCHLTKKHKNRTLGSQSRALEMCGTVYDPNAPRPQRSSEQPTPDDGSRAGSEHAAADDDAESAAASSPPVDDEEASAPQTEPNKSESAFTSPTVRQTSPSQLNGTKKPTIAAMIDPPELEPGSGRKVSPASTDGSSKS